MSSACSSELCGNEVHVWSVGTQAEDAIVQRLEAVLSPDEKHRAARFRFPHLRQSFVITHGVLRCLLGRYLGLDPAGLRFDYGSRGKPALISAAHIEFNAAHSSGLAAFAFTLGCPIGVDLEQVRPLPEMRMIADRFFCPEEAAEIMALEPSQREPAFFRCWTRKEAYIKATGDGLSAPLNEFRVTVQPNEPARFLHIGDKTNAERAWTLHDLQLASSYSAALAYRDRERPLSVFPIVDPRRLADSR